MEVQAISRNIRISPRKVRIVANLVRGKKAGEAISILRNTHKAASIVVEKTLRSAMANAENNNDMNIDKLYISTIFVDAGPIMIRRLRTVIINWARLLACLDRKLPL